MALVLHQFLDISEYGDKGPRQVFYRAIVNRAFVYKAVKARDEQIFALGFLIALQRCHRSALQLLFAQVTQLDLVLRWEIDVHVEQQGV